MAASLPDGSVVLPRVLAGLLAAVLVAAAPAAERGVRGAPITVDAASSELDYRTNTVVFRDVKISQGAVQVAAREAQATGLDFQDSRWSFRGDVHIEAEGGRLASDTAIVRFLDNAIAHAQIAGSPAEFEQPLKSTATARGHASSIEYDVGAGTVRFSGDAWLTDGRNEIRGQQLVYDIRAQRVQASARAGAEDRVRIIINPPATEGRQAPPP